jgi:uncharacterized protein (UPF0548 family)
MWRTTPLHRRERPGWPERDEGPVLPEGIDANGLQSAADGVGTLFHRRYRIRVDGARMSPSELIGLIAADPNVVAPTEFARFRKVDGDEGRLRVGDELVVRMPGPWDGPVRVVDVTETSFRFATMHGHLEAGQIEFRSGSRDDELVFTIESWARSGDWLSGLMYGRLHMAKEIQLHMWTSFLERAASLSGGRMTGGIDIDTRAVDEGRSGDSRDRGTPGAGGNLRDPGARQLVDALHEKALNFDPGRTDEYTAESGWHLDNYRQQLPPEPPGAPSPLGSWEIARGLMRDYEFADPSIVRAVYRPEDALDERDMLLVARYHGLRFRLGVRVGGVRDETRTVGGQQVRVWGWNYRTLQGHLEMGQMDYEVWKWLDTGRVEFRICAYSRRARTGNPVVRLGFRLLGRRQQVRFARRACARMASLTRAAMDDPERAPSADSDG